MALITCQECGKEHSDTIESCPHCGYQRNAHKEKTEPESAPKKEKKKNSGCTTLIIIGVIVAVIWMIASNVDNTPKSTYKSNYPKTTTPTYDTKDYRYVHKTVNMRSGPGTNHEVKTTVNRGSKVELLSTEGDWCKVKTLGGTEGYIFKELLKYSGLPDIEIVDWSWRTDPSFGTDGSVIWVVQLRNNTSSYVDMVKVEISIFDKQGRLTETDYTYVKGLSPGGTASDKSYATYYGTEEKASIRVVN
ncbi:MAG: SH3 domain-containing protein [Cyclobacteriaceae bacterium]